MSRFSRYDTDEERLPDGMTRVGYDADTQVYTFQDADGSYWESAPGSQYGRLTRVGSGPVADDDASDSDPFMGAPDPTPKTSWRHDMMPLLNFGVLVGLSLLALFWFIGRKTPPETVELVSCPGRSVTVQVNDSCWDLAEAEGITVDEMVAMNTGLDCSKLPVGYNVCLSAYLANTA